MVLECTHEMFPGLAGSSRMFLVQYGDGRDIEKDDVEVIRKDLESQLRYENRPCLNPTSSLPFRLMLTAACIRTKAWSASEDSNGQITWRPEKIGPSELRESVSYFIHSRNFIVMADDDCNTAPARENMYEDDPSPGDYDGGDWGGDYDGDYDGHWNGEWDYRFPEFNPPPQGRGTAYANDYEQSDRYRNTPDPFPRPGRQRNPFTNDFGHGDRHHHSAEPFPPRGGLRNPFTNNSDPRGRYQPSPEPTPRRNDRRSSYANDHDRDYQYEDFSPRYANNNRRRHTFGPEDDVHGRFQQAWGSAPSSPSPRNRGHGRRNGDLGDIFRRGSRPAPGISPARDRDGTPWDLSMHNPRNAVRPFHGGFTSIQDSIMYRDAIRRRTQTRRKSGRFWRVVRSFFGVRT